MSVETFELDKKMLEYSISQLRNIPEYVKMCEAFSVGATTIQDAINYLSNMMDIDKSEGVWLDYLASLVGTNRTTYDISNYFRVNAEDLNVEKLFYFDGISSTEQGSLEDIFLKKRIKSKIAYNTSKATRNENIKIIKGLVNADKVIIHNARNYDNFTTVGSPTISSDGIASGFSSANKISKSLTLSGSKIVVKAGFYYKTPSSNGAIIGLMSGGSSIGRCYVSTLGNIIMVVPATSSENLVVSTSDLARTVNDYIVLTMEYNENSTCKFTVLNASTGLSSTKTSTVNWNKTVEEINSVYFGSSGSNLPYEGSIDLNKFSIIVDNKLVYVPYTQIPMLLDITLQGDNLFYPSVQSLRNNIESLLGNGVGVRNLTIL